MEIIRCENLTKVYRRFEKEEGLGWSLKSLFHRKMIEKRAVDALSLFPAIYSHVDSIAGWGRGRRSSSSARSR